MEAITDRQQIITEELCEFQVSKQEGDSSERRTELRDSTASTVHVNRATTGRQLAVASVPDKDGIIKAREKT